MKRLLLNLLSCLWVITLFGCASTGSQTPTAQLQTSHKTIRASGFSHFDDSSTLTVHQRWQKAQQAAKLDANRDLAAQLYRESLDGNKTIGSQVMANEAYRLYLDTFLRNAQAVDYRTMQDVLKASMEIQVTPRFYNCMSGDVETVTLCLQQDNKLALSRLGFKAASTHSVNLNCGSGNCADQYYVQGYSKQADAVDSTLLDAGLYDKEWLAHTSASVFSRLYLLHMLINGF